MQVHELVAKLLPTRAADAAQRQPRLSQVGDQYAMMSMMPPGVGALEGCYYRASNPTFDTALALGIDTAQSDTASAAVVFDNDAAATRDIILDYVRWTYVVAPASATSVQIGVVMDNKNRFASAGSLASIYNARSDVSAASVMSAGTGVLRLGDVTANANGTPRRFGRATLKSAIPVIGDSMLINFGSIDFASMGLLSGAGAAQFVNNQGPVVIAPGHSAVLHIWHPGNAVTAATVLWDIGWWER